MKIYFIFVLEYLLLKIESPEITPFLCKNLFGIGGDYPLPPGYALGIGAYDRSVSQCSAVGQQIKEMFYNCLKT